MRARDGAMLCHIPTPFVEERRRNTAFFGNLLGCEFATLHFCPNKSLETGRPNTPSPRMNLNGKAVVVLNARLL